MRPFVLRACGLCVLALLLASACVPTSSPTAFSPSPTTVSTATPSPTPQASSTPQATVAPTNPPNCTNAALLLQETVPDDSSEPAGASFTKTWDLKNTGTCAWNANYDLIFVSGDKMKTPDSTPLKETLPGSTLNISVGLVAPVGNGRFTGVYELRAPSGQAIPVGLLKSVWVKIIVGTLVIVQPTSTATAPVAAGSAPTSPPSKHCKALPNAGYAAQVIALINGARQKAGLPTLTGNAQLTAAAQGHSDDMACNNFLSHTGSNGSSIYDRITTAGYAPSYWEEIIYAGGGPQDAFNWWMNDKVHHDAILDPKNSEVGAAYTFVAGSAYGGYFTVDFGSQ